MECEIQFWQMRPAGGECTLVNSHRRPTPLSQTPRVRWMHDLQ